MPWWAWLALGALLLAAEIGISADFWLAMVGAAAFGPALLGLAGVELPLGGQWLLFGGASVLLAIFVRGAAYRRLMGGAKDLGPELLGEEARARQTIAPGTTGEVELRGSVWRAHNAGEEPVVQGEVARVEGVDGVVLRIRRR